jgi:hypothetical protein
VHRQLSFLGNLPQRVPAGIPERRDIRPIGNIKTAQDTVFGDALDLRDCGADIVARN